jgi:hypothetical protein
METVQRRKGKEKRTTFEKNESVLVPCSYNSAPYAVCEITCEGTLLGKWERIIVIRSK